jgi:hypothetical protein
MKVLSVWAVSNLVWMALVYCVTIGYRRLMKRPTDTLLTAIGTVLAATSALTAIWWWAPFMIHTPPGTFRYYIGVVVLAAAGPAMCFLVFLVLASAFDEFNPDEIGWLNQLLLPFYVSLYLFGGFIVLAALIGFLIQVKLLFRATTAPAS